MGVHQAGRNKLKDPYLRSLRTKKDHNIFSHSELEDVFPFLAVIHTENMKGQIVHIMLRDEEYMGQKGAEDWGFYICLVQKKGRY